MTATQSRAAEIDEKVERVRGYLDETDSSGVLLSHPFLVSWITAGSEDVILRGEGEGFVWAVVTPERRYLVTSNIEARRLESEEGLEELGFELVEVPWYEGHFSSAVAERCDVERLVASNNAFGILWANPPYDHDKVAKGSKRIEFTYLRHAWKWVW